MASKHITEDEINFLVNAKVSQAQQEIRKFEKDVSKLEDRNRSLRKQMDESGILWSYSGQEKMEYFLKGIE